MGVMTIDKVAELCHETNRIYCESVGDHSQKPWSETSEEFKNSSINGVQYFYSHPEATPENMHESWMEERLSNGWRYGEVKDVERKTHPCLVPYDQLSKMQRVKDEFFLQICKICLD